MCDELTALGAKGQHFKLLSQETILGKLMGASLARDEVLGRSHQRGLHTPLPGCGTAHQITPADGRRAETLTSLFTLSHSRAPTTHSMHDY